MNKTVEKLILVENRKINNENNLLILKSAKTLSDIKAGQFVNILVESSPSTFLRRPLSINFVDYTENTLHILIKRVGDGSNTLCNLEAESLVDTIYPLGNSFSIPEAETEAEAENQEVLLIGGGVGVAPMLILANQIKSAAPNTTINILLGARREEDQILLDEFKKYGTVLLTTEDGSLGEKGYVTNHSIFTNGLQNIKMIYTCGPDVMMQAVAKEANRLNVNCEVSLENMMACGFGVCLCCVTETVEGNQCVCTKGPVFNTKNLAWQI